MNNKVRILAIATCVILLAWAQASENRVTVAQGVDPTTMDPHMQVETTTINVLANIFDALTLFDRDNNVQPALAESWRVVDDTTWEFELREGVLFHDGSEFTAEDAAFSIMRVAGPESRSPDKSRFSMIADVEVINPSLIHIVTHEPYPIMPGILSGLRIASKQYVEAGTADVLNAHPVGTGPFKFVSWEKDRAITLEANEDYWRGAPQLDEVVFRPIPEASTRLAELVSGGVDIITNLLPHTIANVEASGVAEVKSIPSTRYVFVGMNLELDTPLSDQRVRQALNYAIDKEGLIRTVLQGNGAVMSQPTHSVHFGYDAEVQPYPYDPERAQALLAEAGYNDGFSISMMAPTGRYLNDQLAAEAIAGQLGNIGINVDLEIMEWGNFVGKVVNERSPAPLFFLGWGSVDGLDADGIYIPLLGSDEGLSFYSNAALDSVVREARSTLNVDERIKLYSQAARITHEDAPWVFLWNQHDLYGVNKRVNWDPVSFETIWLYEASVEE